MPDIKYVIIYDEGLEPAALEIVTKQFGQGTAVYVYGEGPWIVSNVPLAQVQINAILHDALL